MLSIGLTLAYWLERLIARYSLVRDRPFFDPAQFVSTAVLEAIWRGIRPELD